VEDAEALVVRSRQGDVNAFGTLVRKYQGMVVGYAYSVLGDFALAEDAAQDAFVQAYLDLGSLRDPRAFAGWLRRIAFKYCHAQLRRNRAETVAVELTGLPSREKDPAEQAQQREVADQVLKAVRALPPGERTVTTLFHIDGYSQEQISGFLGVPVGTVKTRLRRARARMEERMLHMVDRMLKDNAPDERFSKAVLLKLPQLPDGELAGPVSHLPATLDEFQARLILSAMPKGTEIVELKAAAWIYRYPLLVQCRLANGEAAAVELHVHKGEPGSTPREVHLLPVLAELGLPVQQVLAGPASHPDYPEVGPLFVLSHLLGKNALWLKKNAAEVDLGCRLLIEGIHRLRELTEPLRQHPVGKTLPRRTLTGEFDRIVERGGPWMEEPPFRDAVSRLRPALEAVALPLVFSNGLNIMQNFVCDGEKLTGYQWFAGACFEDPHIQFPKYKYYAHDTIGWGLYEHAGLVEKYLYDQDVSKSQFAPRLALECLTRLQMAMPVKGKDKECGRERAACLSLLDDSMRLI
jgi:RNA polymerase sigma factor (sigma-70 family)